MIAIWIYKPMNLVDWSIYPADDRGPVIELDAYREESWWSGYAVCNECGYLLVAVIKGEAPETVPCPRCRKKSAIPQEHWFASGEIWCGTCGYSWKEIFPVKTDILPKTRQCRRCSTATEDIRPWPYTN